MRDDEAVGKHVHHRHHGPLVLAVGGQILQLRAAVAQLHQDLPHALVGGGVVAAPEPEGVGGRGLPGDGLLHTVRVQQIQVAGTQEIGSLL